MPRAEEGGDCWIVVGVKSGSARMSRYARHDAIGVGVDVEVGRSNCSKDSAANGVRGLSVGDW